MLKPSDCFLFSDTVTFRPEKTSCTSYLVGASNWHSREGVSHIDMRYLRSIGYRIVKEESSPSFVSYYKYPNPFFEASDAAERLVMLALVRIARSDTSASDFVHRGERWVYCMYLASRNVLPDPPVGLDIDYDNGIVQLIHDDKTSCVQSFFSCRTLQMVRPKGFAHEQVERLRRLSAYPAQG